jgi:CheY-like chemotaxis protein
MPGMNGLDLVSALRARHIDTPAILITSHPNQSLRDRAAAAGVPIVEKPLLNSLLDHVRRTISQAGN